MKYSQIFLSMSSFLDLKNKLAVQENYNDKKKKNKKIIIQINQVSILKIT